MNTARYLVIVLIAAAILVGISIYLYNRRLDKVVKGEDRDAHNPFPEPRTAAEVIYKTVLMGIAIVALLTASATRGQVTSLQNAVSSLQQQEWQLSSEIRELREQLENGEKQVSEFAYEILNADFTNRTAEVKLYVTLKEFSEDTVVSVSLNGREVALKKAKGSAFEGQFTADLFGNYEPSAIMVTKDGKTYSEDAGFPGEIFRDFLPVPNLECSFNSVMSLGRLTYEGCYSVLTDHAEDIESVKITYMTGGRDIKTQDITKETQQREEITLEKGLKLEKDLTFRIEVMTKNGFVITNQMPVVFEAVEELKLEEFLRITDRDGNTLWEDFNEKYK